VLVAVIFVQIVGVRILCVIKIGIYVLVTAIFAQIVGF
jgi:hypothetical protein